MATYSYTTIATAGGNGPIVRQLSDTQTLTLAANYLGGYTQNFARLALQAVNPAVHIFVEQAQYFRIEILSSLA